DSLSINPSIIEPEKPTDSTFMTADTLFSQVIPLRDYVHLNIKLGKENDDLEEEEYEELEPGDPNQLISQASSNITDSLVNDSIPPLLQDSLISNDSLSIKTDSLNTSLDSLKKDTTQLNSKDLKILETDSIPQEK